MEDFDDLFDAFDECNDQASSRAITGAKRQGDDVNSNSLFKKLKTDVSVDDINLESIVARIRIHKIDTLESCTHEVAVPAEKEYIPLENVSKAPAKEYKFTLDSFQKEAILCIENNQSVLVSAHTSAGKTVVAEYAIACSLRAKQRVIYTTPIKALSNQKFREFSEEFKDVGLMTGDITINPTASILIMTTEILRNMLYRGSEVMREVGWVIFDEIHYMRDKERGVVWEETLILLPDNVHYVFLSATIPNARQFAEWIVHLHHQPCHVVYTDYRPTPLQHYIFPAGGDGIHLVVDESGQFKEDNFNKAINCLQGGSVEKNDISKNRRSGSQKKNFGQSSIFKIVKMIMEHNFAPVIIFSFSKRDCEAYALQLAKLDLNTTEEKKLVDEIFKNAIEVLSEDDRKIPQIQQILPLLRRGIGVHHGGLLPIIKETVEILFGEGLIKALFATETFAMGLNMPARTVVFAAPKKFDGKDFRMITSGEYIQMSGRAGRRGLDKKGIVILMIDEQVSPTVCKEIVQGKADPMNSAFHLTYNMVLNLLRVEDINPEFMLEKSFYQFQNEASIPDIFDRVKNLQEKYEEIKIDQLQYRNLEEYHKIKEQLEFLNADFRSFLTKPKYLSPFCVPGRLIQIQNDKGSFGWGVLIKFKKKKPKESEEIEQSKITLDVLLNISKDCIKESPVPCPEDEEGKVEVVSVLLTNVAKISEVRMKFPSNIRREPKCRKDLYRLVQQLKNRFPQGIPLLDPIKDMRIKETEFKEIVKKIKALEKKLKEYPVHQEPNANELYKKYMLKEEIGKKLDAAKTELKRAKSILQMDELRHRKRVLRRLVYCTASDVIEIKGRVACELNGADELLLTEMIFNGLFNSMTVPQMTSLISCFVCDEKSTEMPKSVEELSEPLRQMHDIARRIAKISAESNIDIDEDAYIERFKPFLMDVVYAWCKGATFLQISQMTDIYEGSIIRCMRRLEEVLRQLSQAAKSIGNTDLENKFCEAIKLIKRDIIFAASLYL
ncbi:superkiller viralicidic activity 2-like 2 [Copidosoma floridanum]|uniref:superkiller viralicidic activity 2-like 2 n=1 Tax=Copidosoma floridanum TaxID=29053 RepID=UPI0006C9ACB6|nr:superkiller viralicidic activity 2-like 2 [Copidosoma floridanum]